MWYRINWIISDGHGFYFYSFPYFFHSWNDREKNRRFIRIYYMPIIIPITTQYRICAIFEAILAPWTWWHGELVGGVVPETNEGGLNLRPHPFNCHCHMAWFADWLRRRGLTNSGPRCVKPVHLKNKAIHSLATHEFRCTSKLINSQFKICLSLHHTQSVHGHCILFVILHQF